MKVPYTNFKTKPNDEWINIDTPIIFDDKKIVVFALPGAFTPTCSLQQLLGYEELYDEFKANGIDEVYCLSVNDNFVMHSWILSYTDGDRIIGIADGNGEICENLNLLTDKTKNFMGMRSKRFAMIVRDNIIEKTFIEEPGEYKVSSAEHLLTVL